MRATKGATACLSCSVRVCGTKGKVCSIGMTRPKSASHGSLFSRPIRSVSRNWATSSMRPTHTSLNSVGSNCPRRRNCRSRGDSRPGPGTTVTITFQFFTFSPLCKVAMDGRSGFLYITFLHYPFGRELPHFLFPVYPLHAKETAMKALIAVSYTHLTLPTNREV